MTSRVSFAALPRDIRAVRTLCGETKSFISFLGGRFPKGQVLTVKRKNFGHTVIIRLRGLPPRGVLDLPVVGGATYVHFALPWSPGNLGR